MGQKTSIEYCDSTCNPLPFCRGCELYSPDPGENHCYAATLVNRYAGKKGWPDSFTTPTYFPERIEQALKWGDLTGTERPDKPWLNGLPRIIFLNDMGDSFSPLADPLWLDKWLEPMAESPHLWLLLTKWPHLMRGYFEYREWIPENFILGTSILEENGVAEVRLSELLATKNVNHFWISMEPMLGPINLNTMFLQAAGQLLGNEYDLMINCAQSLFVACGGESGANRRPFDPDWARSVRDQCSAAEVPFFMKQIDKVRPIPPDLMVRQIPRRWRST